MYIYIYFVETRKEMSVLRATNCVSRAREVPAARWLHRYFSRKNLFGYRLYKTKTFKNDYYYFENIEGRSRSGVEPIIFRGEGGDLSPQPRLAGWHLSFQDGSMLAIYFLELHEDHVHVLTYISTCSCVPGCVFFFFLNRRTDPYLPDLQKRSNLNYYEGRLQKQVHRRTVFSGTASRAP